MFGQVSLESEAMLVSFELFWDNVKQCSAHDEEEIFCSEFIYRDPEFCWGCMARDPPSLDGHLTLYSFRATLMGYSPQCD